jgi:hypothetical protein
MGVWREIVYHPSEAVAVLNYARSLTNQLRPEQPLVLLSQEGETIWRTCYLSIRQLLFFRDANVRLDLQQRELVVYVCMLLVSRLLGHIPDKPSKRKFVQCVRDKIDEFNRSGYDCLCFFTSKDYPLYENWSKYTQ